MNKNIRKARIYNSYYPSTIESGDLVCVKIWPALKPNHKKHPYSIFGFKNLQDATEKKYINEVSVVPKKWYHSQTTGQQYVCGVVLSKHVHTYKTLDNVVLMSNFFKVLLENSSESLWFFSTDIIEILEEDLDDLMTIDSEML
jgi:hypothetical protein